MPMARKRKWRMALHKYSVGLDGGLRIREVDELFGNKWRLRKVKAVMERLVKMYSERNSVYRAFETEYGRTGHIRGVKGAVAYLKQK